MNEQTASNTAESAEETIIRMQKEIESLKESNKDLEHFAYVASHDLQSPLRTVEGFLKVIHQKINTAESAELEDHFKHVFAGLKRLQILIQDLLDYSRAGRNVSRQKIITHPMLELTKYDLRSLLQEFPYAKLVCKNLPESFLGHRTSISQLFQNLLANAIKFADKGKKNIIEISAEETETHWQFYIKDQGIGIAKEDGLHIFDLFTRLHSREVEDAGTGIGLALCKRIAEAHGGKIYHQSNDGEGSCFAFSLKK